MKRIKLNLAIVALMLGSVAAFAFKSPQPKPFSNPFWHYNGGNPDLPGSYTKVTGMPFCPGTTDLCAIEAPQQTGVTPAQPVISNDLKGRIDALNGTAGDVLLQDN